MQQCKYGAGTKRALGGHCHLGIWGKNFPERGYLCSVPQVLWDLCPGKDDPGRGNSKSSSERRVWCTWETIKSWELLGRGVMDAWGKRPNARTLVRDRREVGVGVMFAEETCIRYRKSGRRSQGYKTIERPHAENGKKKKLGPGVLGFYLQGDSRSFCSFIL